MSTVWDDVVGQGDTVELLRRAAVDPLHAYLFIGPHGSTKRQAARAFAAMLLTGDVDPTSRDARLVLHGEHPDVREVERVGPAINKDTAREIVKLASLAPNESDRKVMILHEFHLLAPEAAAVLLKTVEEPPPSTVFVILADFLPTDLITIASRCARIPFRSISDEVVGDRLISEGVDPETASEAARSANGDLDRARLLAGDPELVVRRRAFATVPERLDGTGAAVIGIVEELTELIERAATPLVERQAAEAEAVQERIERFGERGSGKKALEERHKRELRRHRADELRLGLSELAGTYRDALVAERLDRPDAAADAVHHLHEAIAVIDRNPNEALLLQSLLWSLPVLSR
jgi:DNA polymerase III subunit delta'